MTLKHLKQPEQLKTVLYWYQSRKTFPDPCMPKGWEGKSFNLKWQFEISATT